MRARFVLAVAAALLGAPAPAMAAGPQDAASPAYAREERSLGGGARLFLESVVIEGTALTDAMREATDLASLAGANVSRVQGEAGAVQFKTIGRRMTAVNQLGWVVIQYTIWQEFGYDGTKITHAPPPTFDYNANWGWTLRSHTEAARWLAKPTYRTSRGDYLFDQDVWTPYGSIGLGELSGWVAVFYRGTGSWTGANS